METKICKVCNIEKSIENFRIFNKEKGYRINHCRDCKIEYLKRYTSENVEQRKIRSKEYRNKNKEIVKERKKNYYLNNKEKIREYKRKWEDKRRNDGTLFKLKQLVRHRIGMFMKINNMKKTNKTFDIVGCSPEFLKEHLEKQFKEGMTWEKMGKEIHIDHIIPLSSAKTEEDIYKLCHYTNLQPLWAQENLSKGNRII
jgi:hypothetical protein